MTNLYGKFVRDMTPAEMQAVELLSKIDTDDPEHAHSEADDIVLAVVHPAVAQAYDELVSRCRWWASA